MSRNRQERHDAASCPSWESMVGYFEESLTDSEMAAVDNHFANCELCIDHAREAHEFVLALETWTPQAHGEAWRRELLRGAVEQLALSASGPVAARMRSWLGQIRDVATGAVRVLADVSGASIVTSGLAGVLRQDAWRFEPQVAVRGTQNEAVRCAVAEDAGWRVAIKENGAIEVSSDAWPAGDPLPAAILIDESGDSPVILIPLERTPDNRVVGTVSSTGHSSLLVFLSGKLPPTP